MGSLTITISGRIVAVMAIVFGIVILIVPDILAILIGIYLVVMGILHFVKKSS